MEGAAPMPAPPTSIREVEALIQELYRPNAGNAVGAINKQLLQLQTSPQGWTMAEQLLASQDPNVRFYAAGTFIVKLNTEGHTFDPETAQTVLLRLISWLARLVRQGESGHVLKKLCSVLTTYFIQSPITWERPLFHVALSFQNGDAVNAEDTTQSASPMPSVLTALDPTQMRALLWFAETLAEEAGKLTMRSQAYARHHAEMDRSVTDAVQLIHWGLNPNLPSQIKVEALRTYLGWVHYKEPVYGKEADSIEQLRALIEEASQCLLDDELSEDALDIFRDMLDSYMTFFRPQHMELLSRIVGDHLRPQVADDESLPVVQFIVALGCANIQQVIEDPSNKYGSMVMIEILMGILETEGIPGDSDVLSIHTIEFWNTYIEYVNDLAYSRDLEESPPAWLDHTKQVLIQAVKLLYQKLWIPPADRAQSWTDAERESFKEFRLDCTDLMLSIFIFLGQDMLQLLLIFALSSLEVKRWRGIEAAMFCLTTLSDNVLEEPENEAALAALFNSNLFVEMADFSQEISTPTRRTAIDMLGSYSGYIANNPEFLPDTVRFLFASLEQPSLAKSAARNIDSFCSTCRTGLTDQIFAFLDQYDRFLASATSDPFTKQKVIGAIAAIIQAIKPESAKEQPLLRLIGNIETDVNDARRYADEGDTDMVEVAGVSALECLACVGKGMQAPEENSFPNDKDERDQHDFWLSERGQNVQERITAIFGVLRLVGTYAQAVDAACHVLRSGFAETMPGPFVLPPSVTVNFLRECSVTQTPDRIVTTPQLEAVLSTAGMLITANSRRGSRLTDNDAQALFQTVASFTATLRHGSNDSGVAAGCIELWTRMIPAFSHVLFMNISPSILDFTLTAVEAPETFPKRAALEFWSKVIKPQTRAVPPEVQSRIDEVMSVYGPKFVLSITRQIGGHAQRSDLDGICTPLQALMLRQPHIKQWLEQGLDDSSFPRPDIDPAMKKNFLQRLFATRADAARVRDTVKEFWAACRGTIVSYSTSV